MSTTTSTTTTTRDRGDRYGHIEWAQQEGLAVASIARDVVIEMTPPRDDNAR